MGVKEQPKGKTIIEDLWDKESPWRGEDEAKLTSILIIFIHAGDVRAAHEKDGVDGDGLVASGVPWGL